MAVEFGYPQAITKSARTFSFVDKRKLASIDTWYFDYWSTAIGWLRACTSDSGLFSLSWQGRQKPPLNDEFTGIASLGVPSVAMLAEYKDNLLCGEKNGIAVHLYGTTFQCRVWRELLDLNVKETISYRNLARAIGSVNSQRAVGSAVGRNPIFLFVACHRVIASDGSLGGYAYGLALKQQLLLYEQQTGESSFLIQK